MGFKNFVSKKLEDAKLGIRERKQINDEIRKEAKIAAIEERKKQAVITAREKERFKGKRKRQVMFNPPQDIFSRNLSTRKGKKKKKKSAFTSYSYDVDDIFKF